MRRAVVCRTRGVRAGGSDTAGGAGGGGCHADIGGREGAKPAPDKARRRDTPPRRAATPYVTRDFTSIFLRRQAIEWRAHHRRVAEMREAVGERAAHGFGAN